MRKRRRNKTNEERFWAKVKKTEHCWEWLAFKPGFGYGRFSVDCANIAAHRFSWIIHFGPIPNGMVVCHKCDNPSCVRPDHLFIGTLADNNRDRDAKNRTAKQKGELHGMNKLTQKQIDEIRFKYGSGIANGTALAKEYGICFQQVYRILNRERWK